MSIALLAKAKFDTETYIDLLGFNKGYEEKIVKEKEKLERINNELIFSNEFSSLYKMSDKEGLDKELLFPYKIKGDGESLNSFIVKNLDEYRKNVNAYIDSLNSLHFDNHINEITLNILLPLVKKLAKKQEEKIIQEQKELKKASKSR